MTENNEVAVVEEKGLLQSQTVWSIVGLVLTGLGSAAASMTDLLPQISLALQGALPEPWASLVAPVVQIIIILLTFFFGAKGVQGRLKAKSKLSGLYKKQK